MEKKRKLSHKKRDRIRELIYRGATMLPPRTAVKPRQLDGVAALPTPNKVDYLSTTASYVRDPTPTRHFISISPSPTGEGSRNTASPTLQKLSQLEKTTYSVQSTNEKFKKSPSSHNHLSAFQAITQSLKGCSPIPLPR